MYVHVYVASCLDCKTVHCLTESFLLYLLHICGGTSGVLLGLEYSDAGLTDKALWLVNLCAFHHHAGVPQGRASPVLLHHQNQA